MKSEILTKKIKKVAQEIAGLSNDIDNNKSRKHFYSDLIKQKIFELYELNKELLLDEYGNPGGIEKDTVFLRKDPSREMFRTERDAVEKEKLLNQAVDNPPVVQEKEITQKPVFIPDSEEVEESIPNVIPEPIKQTPVFNQSSIFETEINTPKPEVAEEPLIEEKAEEPVLQMLSEPEVEISNEEIETSKSAYSSSSTWLSKLLEETVSQKRSSNDLTQRLQNTPISNFNNSISISQKHEYINELFAGKSEVYRDTLQRVEELGNIEESLVFLESEVSELMQWPKKEKLVAEFLFLIRRRFVK